MAELATTSPLEGFEVSSLVPPNLSFELKDTTEWPSIPTVVERYNEELFYVDPENKANPNLDMYIHLHSNGIATVGLAQYHPLIVNNMDVESGL